MPQDKLTAVRIKQQNGQYGPQIPVGAKAENVKYDNMYSVKEVLGNVKTNVGPLQEQIDNIDTEAISGAVTDWLEDNPGALLPTDKTLSIADAPADAQQAGKVVTINSETDGNATKIHLNTTNDVVNVLTTDDIDPDDFDTLAENFADVFVPDQAYVVGDYCIYQYQLYQCKTAIAENTDHSFVAAHWDVITITDTINNHVNNLKMQINDIDDAIYSYTELTISATSTGWRLNESDGYCSLNSEYKIIKYQVVAGNVIKIISDDRFQFQNSANVPSGGQSNRIGDTYGIGTFIVTVPEGATYLIMSTPLTSNAMVYGTEGANERINDLKTQMTEYLGDLKTQITEYLGFFEFIKLNKFTLNGIIFTKNLDGSYSATGTATNDINYGISTFTLLPGTYLFNAGATTNTNTYYLYLNGINGGTSWIRDKETFTVIQNSTVSIRFYCPNGQNVNNVYKPSVSDYPKLSTINLQEEIDTNKEKITGIEEVLPKTNILENVVNADTQGWENGYFYYAGAQNILTKSAYAALSCKYYGPVTAGEKFTVTARSAGSGYAIILCNSSNIVIDTLISQTGYYDDVAYTVPYDGLLYLNTIAADYLTGAKKYSFNKYVTVLKDLSSVLRGIKWYSIGDSLNEFNSTAETNWIKYMIANTEIDNINLAKSGAGFYRGSPMDGQTQINYIKQLESVGSDAELITIAGSFNDLMSTPWTSLPVGTATDTGTNSIAGYMNAFFDALLTAFPTTAIGVLMTSPWDVYKPGVTASDDYVTVLQTICRNRGIPFYADCYFGCNLKPWLTANKTEYYTKTSGSVDGVHPNSKGHIFLYRMLKPFLEKIAYAAK